LFLKQKEYIFTICIFIFYINW